MSSEPLLSRENAPVPAPALRQCVEPERVFDELPTATIVQVSRPDVGDISSLLLSYTIEFRHKQFRWKLVKKASQVIYLHFALNKRAIKEEFHERHEQVREWLQNLGIGDQTAVVEDDDEPDDGAVPFQHEGINRNRSVPSCAALPIIRPALGGWQSISDQAKVAMQGYLNHFLGNMDIVNSREVCRFLEVSKLSFSKEYGPKLKEDYVMVKHLGKNQKNKFDEGRGRCCCFSFCESSWHKVWAVLKPGFLALLDDPFDGKLVDIVIFDILPASEKREEGHVNLATEIKDTNPLRHSFKVSCGTRTIKLRTTSKAKVKEWIAAVNNVGLRPPEGWCNPHQFGSFAPQRGLIEDGSHAQWFLDGHMAFEAIASAIEEAKTEIFITGWWVSPELYLRRPFESHSSSRLDALLEAKAKQGVQIYILLYKEVALALKINSFEGKKRLLSLHENVRVLRHPDHFSAGIYLWSHHEKIVVVDNRVCFIGGLDLCFGRYDTPEHNVADCPAVIWPGKDYYNPRECEPNSWEDIMKDEVERENFPRMPWHDVQCALWGPPCRDVARHFVQRWNHAKRSRAPNELTIPLLIPHHHMVIPHYMGRSEHLEDIIREKQEKMDRQNSFASQSPVQHVPLLLPQASVINQKKYDTQMNGLLDGFQPKDCSRASTDEVGQLGPCVKCRCQIIRSVSQWSAGTSQTEQSIHRAYCSLIEKAEHFIYIENQFFISGLSGDGIIQNRILEALYRRIMLAHKQQQCFRVIVVIPLLPGFQGGVDDGGAATVRAIMHWQYRTISRGKHSILHNLSVALGPKAHDYISFFGLRSYGSLFNGGPVATSQVYVHSKLMLVDDRIALIGSSNINDRSFLGSRDSEIAAVIEDKELLESSMNGKPWKVGKFTQSLRLSLWSEHLGIHAGEMSQIYDPIAEATYKDIWVETAKKNTEIYQDVFDCIPNDVIRTRAALRESTARCKEKVGHNTIDLGIAPKKLEPHRGGETQVTEPLERLKSVKGLLVAFPLEFMGEVDLRPVFHETEFYASPQVFH